MNVEITHTTPYWALIEMIKPRSGSCIVYLFIVEKEEIAFMLDSIKSTADKREWYYATLNCEESYRKDGRDFLRGEVLILKDKSYERQKQKWLQSDGIYYLDRLDSIINDSDDEAFDDIFRSLYALSSGCLNIPLIDAYPIKGASLFTLLDESTCRSMLDRFNKLRINNPFQVTKYRIKFLRHEEDHDVYYDVDRKQEILAVKKTDNNG